MPKFAIKKKGETLDKLTIVTVLPESIPDGNLVAADGTGDGKDSGINITDINNLENRIDNIVDGTTKVGKALKATQDASGNVITSTYATQASLAATDTKAVKAQSEVDALETELSNYKTTVSSTYATKTATNVIQNDIDGLSSKVSNIETNIKSLATKSEVTTVQSSVDELVTGITKVASASAADKLSVNAGSTTQPVYFSNGVPVKTTYTLGASVPSDAKFTDTVYIHPSAHAATMITEDGTHRFVTDSEKATWNGILDNAKTYTNAKIGELVDSAPETMDTLKEVADAIAEHQEVADALNAAIGNKADGTNGVANNASKLNGQSASYYATAASVTNVVNGTTKVAKATAADSATSATSATKATQDASGNVITSTYATKTELNELGVEVKEVDMKADIAHADIEIIRNEVV